MRLLQDVAVTADSHVVRDSLIARGERIVIGCTAVLPADDVARLQQRLATLQRADSSHIQ